MSLHVCISSRKNFKLRQDDFLYPKAFEDFICHAISGWYGLKEKEQLTVRKKMREWTKENI